MQAQLLLLKLDSALSCSCSLFFRANGVGQSLHQVPTDTILLKVVKLRARIKNQLRKLFPYAALSVGPGTVMRPQGSEALLPCMLCGKIPPLKLFPTTL